MNLNGQLSVENMTDVMLANVETAIDQMKKISSEGWMKWFLHRQTDQLKKNPRKHQLERHKVAKIKLSLSLYI